MAILWSHVPSVARPTKVVRGAPRVQQGLLHGVLRLIGRLEHPVAVSAQRSAVALDQRGEGVVVVRDRRVELGHPRAGRKVECGHRILGLRVVLGACGCVQHVLE